MSVSIKEALDLHRGEPSWTKSLGVNVNAFELAALLERCEKMEAQLEAVKRLAKALTHDPEGCYSSCKECLEASAAHAACLAVGIDPKEL